jgi:hypothetical protein
MNEIVNRVKESGLISMDLGDFRWKNPIEELDIKGQLWQGLVLKEKDFRAWIQTHDWSAYSGKAVFVHCSVDAIIPTWAYMLVASKLTGEGVPYVIGNSRDLEKELLRQTIERLDLSTFQDGRIIIKGCANVVDPAFAMSELMKRLQPVAKSIMYGEPCSTVPVFKRK